MTELAREYGEGLFDLCREEGIEAEALEQLSALRALFREQGDYIRLLSNMSLPRQERLDILDRTLRGQAHPYLLNFLKILCERGALHELSGCEAAFRACYDRLHGVVEAAVTTSEPLSATQRARLLEKLGQMTGRAVRLAEKVDPAVLGGVLLEMDGQRYDSTVRGRLQAVRQALSEE